MSDNGVTLGFILAGRKITGAKVRDVALINALAESGVRCIVWWAIDRDPQPGLSAKVDQRWLYHWARHSIKIPVLNAQSSFRVMDVVGRKLSNNLGSGLQKRLEKRNSALVSRVMNGLIYAIVSVIPKDRSLVRNFAKQLESENVSAVFPMLSLLAPLCLQASKLTDSQVKVVVTYQGYEVYSASLEGSALKDEFLQLLKKTTEETGLPPITVSKAYAHRIEREIGIPSDQCILIPPGIIAPRTKSELSPRKQKDIHPRLNLDGDREYITYFGRHDAEKGIDLLLYAAKICEEAGLDLNLVFAGSSTFGNSYATACRELAKHLQLRCTWLGRVTEAEKSSLLRGSKIVVYPSVHQEPFGIVPVEAMAQGTPVIIPDNGGIAELPGHGAKAAGLTFAAWDSKDLAQKILKLCSDKDLYAAITTNTTTRAAEYSVDIAVQRFLTYLDRYII